MCLNATTPLDTPRVKTNKPTITTTNNKMDSPASPRYESYVQQKSKEQFEKVNKESERKKKELMMIEIQRSQYNFKVLSPLSSQFN